jgi:hypothetical protein
MFMGEDYKIIAHHVECAKHYYYIGIHGSRMLLLIIINFFMMGIDEVFNFLKFIIFHGLCHIAKPCSKYPYDILTTH